MYSLSRDTNGTRYCTEYFRKRRCLISSQIWLPLLFYRLAALSFFIRRNEPHALALPLALSTEAASSTPSAHKTAPSATAEARSDPSTFIARLSAAIIKTAQRLACSLNRCRRVDLPFVALDALNSSRLCSFLAFPFLHLCRNSGHSRLPRSAIVSTSRGRTLSFREWMC